MHIFELQYKLKPDADVDEGLRLFNELAAPVFRKIPGLISVDVYKYEGVGDNTPEWDYVYIEVWESLEAHFNAMGKYIGVDSESELAKTGYYDQVLPTFAKYRMARALPIASIK